MTNDTETASINRGPSGAMYDLLVEKLPNYRIEVGGETRLGIHKLAREIGVSYQYVYKVFDSGERIPIQLARKIIKCSEDQKITGFKPLTLLDLEPFLPS